MRLICNSIPKSGTYLLAAIAQFCGYQDQNLRFVDGAINVVDSNNNLVDFIAATSSSRFGRLEQGSYAPSHLTYSAALAAELTADGIKQLFIYRHPGDILYSYVRFVTYSQRFFDQSPHNAKLQEQMKTDFASDEARLVHVFATMKTSFNFTANLGWLSCAACLPIRFETLYRELLELESGRIGSVLDGIFAYVGSGQARTASDIYEGVYGRGPTFMAGRDKIGQFAKLDRQAISPVLNDPQFRDIVRAYGYAL